ncbi:MAG: helix-turn-helix domain-containing protein [Gammaproteobacteria bacterium]|nr:helix-turn-helix domain-containing protein [Gammaproteobacteria bacterium]
MSSSTMDDAATGLGEHAGLGEMLSKARKGQGLTSAELARQMNLDVRLIEALEAENLSSLPAPVYVRGYLRRLALNLALDEGALLRAYQRLVGTTEPAPLRSILPIETMKPPHESGRRWPWLAAGLILGLAALGFYGASLLPNTWIESISEPAPSVTEQPPAPATTTLPVVPPIEPPPPLRSAETSDPAPAPVVGELSAPAPTPPAAEHAPPRGLELRTDKAESWVQVKDAAGKVLFEGMLKPGSTRQLEGARPFQVVIGRAEAVTLSLDGKPVDLAPHGRPNGKAFIARLGD